MSNSIAPNSTARKSMAAVVAAAAIAVWAMVLPKPAQACWGCWVVPGTSHAFMYGSIYGPYFSYPAYSEYGYGYAPPPYYYGGHYGPYLFVHHRRTYAHRD